MIYKGWLILGFGMIGVWRAKKQSFPFTSVEGESLEDVQDKIDRA